jgi:RimJ/RimL family protein N-acetyltransferase
MPRPHQIEIPAIETERLVLRGFVDGDLEAFTELRADPDVIRFMPGGEVLAPFAREIAIGRIKRYRKEWARGFGVWAVEERETGAMIGYAGLEPGDGTDPRREAELMYVLARAAWGRGLGREAARACLYFGFQHVGLKCVAALTAEQNAASRRVLEAIGMRYIHNCNYSGIDAILYEAIK